MKGNYKIGELVDEINRREHVKYDMVVPANNMRMIEDDFLQIEGDDYQVNPYCHGQIAEKTGIPKRYYDSIGDIPGLRSINVNEWIRKQDSPRLVRTLDGQARAFLSNRYKPFDNSNALNALLPLLNDMKKDNEVEVEVVTSALSDARMHLQVAFPNTATEIRVGEQVSFGFHFSNSEVGAGAVNASMFVLTLSCMNGQVGRNILRSVHLGKELEDGDVVFEQDTIESQIITLEKELRDSMRSAFTEENLNKISDSMRTAAGIEIPATKIVNTVENVTRKFALKKDYIEGILGNLESSKDLTAWGVSSAITRFSQDLEIEDQYEVERTAYRINELTRSDWEQLAA